MELNVENLKEKAAALKAENTEFSNQARAEIGALQQQITQLQSALQQKAREAQRQVDLKDGKVKGLEDLIAELEGKPEGDNIIPFPPADAPNPSSP